MKNGLLIGASAVAMIAGLTSRADAQASNNACGTVATAGTPDVVACISDPQNYQNGIIYNQNNLPTPDGILVDIFGTAIVQPVANTTAVQVIGSVNNVAEVNLRSGGRVTAIGAAAGVVVTSSGTGTSRISTSGIITAAGDGIQTLGGAGAVLNLGSVSSTSNSAIVGAPGLVVTNANGATLAGGTSPTFGYGVQFAGNSGTFNNYGSATGGAGGVTANTNLGNGAGVTLNLFAGSTTGNIALGDGSDTVNLYTGETAAPAVTSIDPVSGLAVTVRAAGDYAASMTSAVGLGGGTNTIGLNGNGTGAQAGTLSLTGAGVSVINKTGAGTWTLTGAANTTVPPGGGSTSGATINAGDGGAGTDGLLIFSGSGLTGAINVNGATIRSTTAAGFGSGPITAQLPGIQYGASTTQTGVILLGSTDTVNQPISLRADSGVAVTLNGTITELSGNQPLVFGLTPGSAAGSTTTFVLGAGGNSWSGVTTVETGTTLRGTTASISGSSIVDNGVVNFNQATTGTSGRAISGTGVVIIDGGGNVTLTGALTTGGGVRVGTNTTATFSSVSGATGTQVAITGPNATVNVASGGNITATNGNAIASLQANNTVSNSGTIASSAAFTAVDFLQQATGSPTASGSTTGTNTVTNSGTIRGFNAIGSNATLVVNNSGTLQGLTGSGVFASASSLNSVITNSGTITGVSAGQTISAAVFIGNGTITNNAGTISGDRGVQIANGGTVNNSAQITAVTGVNGAAVRLNGGGNVTNFGTGTLTAISPEARGIWTSGAGTLDNRGAINADTGIYTTSAATVVANSGTITAAFIGVQGAATSVNLNNSGDIVASIAAVRAEGAGSTITNSGTLRAFSAGAGSGVVMAGGTLTNLSGGTISGGTGGAAIVLTGSANTLDLRAGSTVNGRIDASSTTDASGSYTVSGALNGGFTGGTGDDTLTLITGASVTGTLDGNTGNDALVLNGTGTNGALGSAQVVNFENLTKSGTGTWTLTGTTAASPTNVAITAGTLAVAGGNALADTASVNITGGATLALQANETFGGLNGSGNVTLGANTLTVGAGNGSFITSAVISGSGGLTKIGTGRQGLTGANTYTGPTLVSEGTLRAFFGSLPDATAVTVATGATLDISGSDETVASLLLNGTLEGTGTLTAASYTLNAGLVNANLGAGTLTQASGASLLRGAAAATTVNIDGGKLSLGASDRLANGAAVTVAPAATLNIATFNDTVATLALNGTLDGSGTLTAGTYTLNAATVNANLGTGTLIQAGGVSTLRGTAEAGTVTINAGTLVLGADERLANGAALTVAGPGTLDLADHNETVDTAIIRGTLNSSTTNSGTLTARTYTLDSGGGFTPSSSPVVNGNLGAGTLIVQGKGVSTLNGTAAATTVQINGSTLVLGGDERLDNMAAVTVVSAITPPSNTVRPGVLDIGTRVETVGTLQLTNSTLQGSTGTLTAATYGLNGANVVANLGTGILTQQGGTSTLTGRAGAATVNVDAGTLLLAGDDRLADNAAVTVATDATLNIAQYNDTVGTLTLNGTLDGTGTLTATTYTLNAGTVNANIGTGTLIQASGASTLNGNSAASTLLVNGGSLLLNGTVAATTVNVNAGLLTLGNNDRLADTAALTVATGATLDIATFNDTVDTALINGTLNGSGTLTAMTYALNAATINANLGTGTLTQVSGASTLNGNSAGSTLIVAGGSLLLNGTAAATTVDVNAGLLTLGNNDRLADAAALTVLSGATVNIATFNDTVGTAVINGTLDGSGTLTAMTYALNGALINANLGTGALTQASGASTLNGNSAASTLTVAGGSLLLNGTAAATTVDVNAGTLMLGNNDRLADTAALTVATGATLNVATFNDTVGTAAINGTLAGSGTLTAATYTLNGALVNANLGTGTLIQAGGASTLNGTAGATTVNINAGTLALGASNRLADTAAVTVATGATLNIAAFNDTVGTALINGTLAGSGTLTAATYTLNAATVNANLGAGTLTQASGTSALNGTAGATIVNVNAGTLGLGASDRFADTAALTVATGATLNLNAFNDTVGTAALNGTLAGTGTLTAATYTLNAATVNANLGTGTLTQAGGASTLNGNSAASTLTVAGGSLLLNGTAAATTVNVNAGTLALGAANRLADTAAVAVATGATLNLNAFNDTVGTAALNGTLAGTGTLTAASYTLNGAMVNANLGTGTLNQAGGTSTLNGTAAAAAVNVNAGTLVLGASNRLADTAAVAVATGTTLNLGANNDTVGTAAINGTLAGTGTLTAATYTLNGAAVNANLGTGALVQAGGTSVLAGTAAATTVAINAGVLRLAAADRIADAAPVTVATGATFDLANFNETIGALAGAGAVTLGTGTLTAGIANTDTTYTGTLTGTGDFTKVGTGTQTLTGNEALTGRLNVNAGTLLLNGSTAGAVRVQGGTFAGNAIIAGALTETAGTISPGTAAARIGQIQAASLATTGGTFAIDFGGAASGFTADSLRITGAANLAGTVVAPVALDPSASYRFAQTYQILSATSITGSFANGTAFTQVSTANPDLFYRLRTDLTPNAIVLEVRKIIDFGGTLGVGGTGNQVSVGNALTAGELTGSESFLAVLNVLANQTIAQRQTTFDGISGESIADISTAAGMISNNFVALLRQRLATDGDGDRSQVAGLLGGHGALAASRAATPIGTNASAVAGTGGSGGGAWVQGFGGAGRLSGSNGTATLNDSSYGIAAGLDGQIGSITLGGAFAVTSLDTRIDARAAKNKGTLYQGGGYLAYDDGQTYANLIGSYFSGDVDSRRQVVVAGASQGEATGDTKVHGYSVGAAAGYRVPVGAASRFTPQASIEATQVTRDAFTETGAGLLNLAAARQRRTLYTATLQGRFSHVAQSGSGSIEPFIGAGAAVQFGDRDTIVTNQFTGAPIGTGSFTVAGARLAPIVGLVEVGIDAKPSERITLGISATGRVGENQRNGRVEAHIRFGF